MAVDNIDVQILKYLTQNTRMPFTEIAKKMDVSAGTIHVRVKKMEDAGIIKNTSIDIDFNKLGYSFIAFIGLIVSKSDRIETIIQQLYEVPNIISADVTSGKFSIYCKLQAKNAEDAKNIIFKINEIDGISRTESTISLEESIDDKNRLMKTLFSK